MSSVVSPYVAYAQQQKARFDTAMYAGHRDWTGYATPGTCFQAALAEEQARRYASGSWEDTLVYAPEKFTMSEEAHNIVRSCGARFTLANVAPPDLLDFAHLALIRGNDDEAWRAAERYATSFPAGAEQFEAWYHVDTMFLNAQPLRVAAAERAAARLDSLGVPAALHRGLVHALLLREAERHFDAPRMEREALAEIAANLQTPGSGFNGNVVLTLLVAELFRAPSTDSAIAMMSHLLTSVGLKNANQLGPLYERITGPMGKHMPPYTAKYWFGADSATKTWPVPGKVSIFIGNSGILTMAQSAMWRRLLQKFGSSLNVTLVFTTQGYYSNGPPLTPAEEASRYAKFVFDELRISGATVAVQESPIQTLPDGRRVVGDFPPPFPEYKVDRMLTDRSGTVKLAVFDVSPEAASEATLDAFIARELAR